MNLFFLRHGQAIESAQLHDTERPLSDLGQAQAAAVGSFLRSRGIQIDLALVSPLLRARQTAERIQALAGICELQSSQNLTSSSDPRAIFDDLGKLHAENILLVGHEPHLSKTISLLLGTGDRSRLEMKTCSLALVDTLAPLGPGTGILRWLLPASILPPGSQAPPANPDPPPTHTRTS